MAEMMATHLGSWRTALTAGLAALALTLAPTPSAAAATGPAGTRALETVTVHAAWTSVGMDGATYLWVTGRLSNGRPADLSRATITYTSGAPDVASVAGVGRFATVRAGTLTPGSTAVTAEVTLDGVTKTDDVAIEVAPRPARPFRHKYHQTLTMKMFMAAGNGQVSLTFEQGLEVVKKVDNLTRGIPKIFYLVGWQYDGHDTGYPAWDVVNPKLKRAQDATALESLRWFMREARRYSTTISFHINMLDAHATSPLWNTYLEHDVIARNADGTLRQYRFGYPISYTREWNAGLAQKRIDGLIDMVDLDRVGTVHVDAFHSYIPLQPIGPISPYHGVTNAQEVETQQKIMRYWRNRGVDVTSEFTYSYRINPLLGLQPMAWHFRDVDPMKIPPTLHIGGRGGDPRFGTSMQGEATIRRDPVNLAGFLTEFCTTTLLWYYLNRLDRLSFVDGVVTFSRGVTSQNVAGKLLVRQGDRILRDGDDLFVPALWKQRGDKEIIAYSRAGYTAREWTLPADWNRVRGVDVYAIGLTGLTPVAANVPVVDGKVSLGVAPDTAVTVVPHGAQP
jgi:Endo-alpha-N-acetylgalactosaminidase